MSFKRTEEFLLGLRFYMKTGNNLIFKKLGFQTIAFKEIGFKILDVRVFDG